MTENDVIQTRILFDDIRTFLVGDNVHTEAGKLLDRARAMVERFEQEFDQLAADRNAAWRVANAASDGHARLRARYFDLEAKLGAIETDSAEDIAHRLTVYVDRQTRSYSDALHSSERELDVARTRAGTLDEALRGSVAKLSAALGLKLFIPDEVTPADKRFESLLDAVRQVVADVAEQDQRIIELKQALATQGKFFGGFVRDIRIAMGGDPSDVLAAPDGSPTRELAAGIVEGIRLQASLVDEAREAARAAAAARNIPQDTVPKIINTLLVEVQALTERAVEAVASAGEVSSGDQRDRELADLRHLAAANAEVLQRQGTALGQLQVALLMAGAPKQGDLTAWASNIRNTVLGQRRDLEEMSARLRDMDSARRHELAEMQAAADSLPVPLKPANGYPYALMAQTPIQVFMLLRERALALLPPVNPSPGAPVSGA